LILLRWSTVSRLLLPLTFRITDTDGQKVSEVGLARHCHVDQFVVPDGEFPYPQMGKIRILEGRKA